MKFRYIGLKNSRKSSMMSEKRYEIDEIRMVLRILNYTTFTATLVFVLLKYNSANNYEFMKVN